jgi:hypothetical protein
LQESGKTLKRTQKQGKEISSALPGLDEENFAYLDSRFLALALINLRNLGLNFDLLHPFTSISSHVTELDLPPLGVFSRNQRELSALKTSAEHHRTVESSR